MIKPTFYISCLLLIVLLAYQNLSLSVFNKECPDVTGMPEFNPMLYRGKWFVYSMYAMYKKRNGKCIYYRFYSKDNKFYMNLTSYSIDDNKKRVIHTPILAVYSDEGTFSFKSNKTKARNSTMYVLDTDYLNYAVQYMCYDFEHIFNFQYAYILTRHALPTEKIIKLAQEKATNKEIKVRAMLKIDQSACPVESIQSDQRSNLRIRLIKN